MNETFGFDLPDESKELTDKECVNLVNRIRGNFLSYVSDLDLRLSEIISSFFLRDSNDYPYGERLYLMKKELHHLVQRLFGCLE